MALTPEQISLMAFNDDHGDWNDLAFRDCWVKGYEMGARAIEAETRKADTELIRQMLEALVDLTQVGEEAWGYWRPCVKTGKEVITAARARLEQS